MRRRILFVVGTRPNFMKTAPVIREMRARGDAFETVLVHTGQHYDEAMSDIFLRELGVGAPDHDLGVGPGSHADQTARIMQRLEPVLASVRPDLVLVPGDVNSTLAGALVAAKLQLPVGHIEAGLRSFDRSMPEEINRLLTDQISDLLFIHSPEARHHLIREGRADDHIHFVGNTMIDTLLRMEERIRAAAAPSQHGLSSGEYLVVTLHRPALVDTPLLAEALSQLDAIAGEIPVIFPAHPRTRNAMASAGLDAASIILTEPLGYVDFLGLVSSATAILTDSGGIQEETTFLGIPCFTLRDNTERPVTCEMGTNRLLGLEPARIAEIPAHLAAMDGQDTAVPEFWDGRASERIVDLLTEMDAYATLTPARPASVRDTG